MCKMKSKGSLCTGNLFLKKAYNLYCIAINIKKASIANGIKTKLTSDNIEKVTIDNESSADAFSFLFVFKML